MTIPLVSARASDAPIAYRAGTGVFLSEFLRDVASLSAALPTGGHMFHACTDRYRFLVGLCAALVTDKICLLPPVQTPDMLSRLQAYAPDLFCLHDDPDAGPALPAGVPSIRYPDVETEMPVALASSADLPIPRIPAGRTLAILFTSGSTGEPVPHRKSWGEMVCNAQAGARRLGLAGLAAHEAAGPAICTLVGTVPPQHMYGLECTIMLALHGGAAIHAGRPFYPADVSSALAEVPAPRVLVTSPVHLRALVLAQVAPPPTALILSATAPLDMVLAQRAEQRFGAPLTEIYGSTETGHIATRSTSRESAWQPLPGIVVDIDMHPGDETMAADFPPAPIVHGAHLCMPVALNDAIELLEDGRFLLHGRHADLVNIAGKRTSLAYLNQQLLAIDGVADGVVFVPDHAPGNRIARPLAFVVLAMPASSANARTTARTRILQALRDRLDPAFVPRSVVLLDALPRTDSGKLPQDRLAAMAKMTAVQPTGSTTLAATTPSDGDSVDDVDQADRIDNVSGFRIASGHPALPGHFPGRPIVPGVVLLDRAVRQLSAGLAVSLDGWDIASAKFLSPVSPDEWIDIRHERSGGAIRFTLQAGMRTVASGTLTQPSPAQSPMEALAHGSL